MGLSLQHNIFPDSISDLDLPLGDLKSFKTSSIYFFFSLPFVLLLPIQDLHHSVFRRFVFISVFQFKAFVKWEEVDLGHLLAEERDIEADHEKGNVIMIGELEVVIDQDHLPHDAEEAVGHHPLEGGQGLAHGHHPEIEGADLAQGLLN
ncbi:uncharacterized protein [Parasteatoda tepidariorum]|uniref:uncharacterized protein n=1 Tax=Parasteatoda tepidariorum TaxID=114398 RepID=UPI0039BC3907